MDAQQELAQLRSTVAELTDQVAALTADRIHTRSAAVTADGEPRSTRRGALRLLGAATVGGAAALVVSQPAAADNGISLLGSSNTTGNWTRVDFVSTVPGGTAFMFQAGDLLSPATLSGKPAALGGVSTSSMSPTGVQAYSNQPTGVALHARHVSGSDAILAEAANFGSAVRATSTFGSAVSGESTNRIGVQGSGGSYGGSFGGGLAALRMSPSSFTGPPEPELAHASGELSVDNQGDLWFCSKGTVPERWHRLNQPSFQAIAPSRVYDSRRPAPTPGTLATGLNRLVSVADARNISTGAVTVADVVPTNATAIAANVTVTGTSGSGFLAINPGGDTVVAASTINWFGAGQTLANGVVLTLNASREITAICGGASGATHFVIDVTGYFL